MQSWGLTLHLCSTDVTSADGQQFHEESCCKARSKQCFLQDMLRDRAFKLSAEVSRRLDVVYETKANGDPTTVYYASQGKRNTDYPNQFNQTPN